MVAHAFAQRERVADVVVVVLDGLRHALAHGLVAGEVNDAVGLFGIEDAVEGGAVVDVRLIEDEVLRGVLTHDLADAVERDGARVVQVVDHHDAVCALEQLNACMRPDEPGASGNEDAGILRCLCLCHGKLLTLCVAARIRCGLDAPQQSGGARRVRQRKRHTKYNVAMCGDAVRTIFL